MRVWDVNPGYLNRQSLLGAHREIHALLAILSQGKRGYANHPETVRWRGRLRALGLRHALVAAEMALRGYDHHSPEIDGEPETAWPDSFVNSPAEQFERLAAKYRNRETGRIPLPSSPQQLWAQHKYSVLARNVEAYREIGDRLARDGAAAGLEGLSRELVALLRLVPTPGGVFNALEHLWGYVSGHASAGERAALAEALRGDRGLLLRRIHALASEHGISYVLHSTALNDLAVPPGRQDLELSSIPRTDTPP